MSSIGWILTVGFAALVMAGVPFVFALMLVVIACLIVADIPAVLLAQTLVAGTQSFSLLAIPFFMLAGELMTAGGLSQRLIDAASVLVRHVTGGLAMVTVLSALVFSAISGSAPATTAAIGSILIPAMVARGYDKAFATATAVSSGVLGPLIPPSIAFVIWGVIAEQSIARLFISGILPGIAIASGLLVVCYLHAKRRHVPREPRASAKEIRTAISRAKWALAAPAVVLGGIYSGAFTPTEAAVVSCVYALVIGLFVERRLRWHELPDIVHRAMRVTAIVMSIVAASHGFGLLVAQEQIATKLAAALAENVTERWVMLLGLNAFFFLLAAVMDEIAIMVVLGPILITLANKFGVDPIHFGAIIVTNVAIGMAAPPIGYCLFVGMAISGLKLGEVSRAIWPHILVMLIVLMLTTYVPEFALALQSKGR